MRNALEASRAEGHVQRCSGGHVRKAIAPRQPRLRWPSGAPGELMNKVSYVALVPDA